MSGRRSNPRRFRCDTPTPDTAWAFLDQPTAFDDLPDLPQQPFSGGAAILVQAPAVAR